MNFYRLVTEEDFNNRLKGYMNGYEIPEEIDELIRKGEPHKAVSMLRQLSGCGLIDCKRYCQQYEAFLKAKSDFLAGNAVYTDY